MEDSKVYSIADMAVRAACSCVGVPAHEGNTRAELVPQIQRANPEVHRLLMAFLDASWNWFQLSKQIAKQGQSGEVNADEFKKLEAFANLAEETGKRLDQKLQSLSPR